MMTLKPRDIHHTSSFPSILDSYLYSEGLRKPVSVAKVVTQMKKLNERRVQRPVSAAELQKKKARLEQRHLEAYRRLHRLKDSLSQRYAELLTEKVQRQRQEMKPNISDHLQTVQTRIKQHSRGLTFQDLVGSTIKDNTAFLKSLPKTHYYLILELQRQLGQRKFLLGKIEQEMSCVDQSKTAQLEKQLQQIELSRKSAPELRLDDLLKKKLDVLPKIPISRVERDDHHDTFSKSGGGEWVSSPVLQGKQIQEQDESELPSVFRQELQVPRFSTLQPGFLEAFRTRTVPLRANEPLDRSKSASETQRKLHLMHSLSLFNMVQSRSLLIKNGLMPQNDKGYSIQDMMECVHPRIVSTKEPRCSTDPLLPLQTLTDHTAPETSENILIEEEMNPQADQMTRSEELQNSFTSESTDKVPLSMEDISSHSILLGKTFNKKMWSNYA